MATILALLFANPSWADPEFVPPDGFVKDPATAIEIAHPVLVPVYGAAVIRQEEPFAAKDLADRWLITGTPCPDPRPNVACIGGTAEVEIAKSNGRILRMAYRQ